MEKKIVFSRWKDVPEINKVAQTMVKIAENHARLMESKKSEDRSVARKLWKNLSDNYWDLLFALLDAQTESFPSELTFDDEERLFIDFGYLSADITPVHKDFDLQKTLRSRAEGGVLGCYAFSDYIAECWAMITGNPLPAPVGGIGVKERIALMEKKLAEMEAERDNVFRGIMDKRPDATVDTEKVLQDLRDHLIVATKVLLRVKEYREAKESVHQAMSQDRFRYVEAEKILLLQVSSAQKNEDNPLSLVDADRFLSLHEATQGLARKIIYAEQDEEKIRRRAARVTKACEQFTELMMRKELKNMLTKKRDYITVPAKTARCETSLLCPQDSAPILYEPTAHELDDFCSLDLDMFSVPRIRMYGLPRVIFVPGQGLGTYDWMDHSLLLPVFPAVSPEKSLTYALGTFRWDSDEDRILKNPFEQIKEHRGKSILDMAASFCKNYFLWMTKEKKGYRILPRATQKAFLQMFAPRYTHN